ncbi:phosphomannomutase/phosphoglucomutase [Gammaproteobacteria bacterium]|nr:phosphomannomutase/phosphoglucomutase [Gammaproteobacteria bacterium]
MIKEENEINGSIFRAYDIRGIVGDTLREEDVYSIGRALGTMAIELGEKTLVLARDGRLSGPLLSKSLGVGILSTGCDVIDIGVVPTPLLYYATSVLQSNSGVMLTGSHNPSNYNGLKMVLAGKTLTQEQIKKLYNYVINDHYINGSGHLDSINMVERYASQVSKTVHLKKPLKIVIDCGNGVAGAVAPYLYKQMGCEVIELYCEVDGNFPNHHPDPSQIENLNDLIEAVKLNNADVGLAFDGDGDRLGVVTNEGEIIWPDRQLMLFAKSILKHKPGAKIIYDVKCSSHLETLISDFGGCPIMWKTGHSFIKSKLYETKADLAGEMSGHIFFKDGWYGFDDALYAGARLLQIIVDEDKNVSQLFSEIPNSVNTPELKINVADDEKFLLMKKISENISFKDAEIINIDGVRVNFKDGWGLVRASNTTPCLVLRFEADTLDSLLRIKKLFKEFLLSIKSDLVLPF